MCSDCDVPLVAVEPTEPLVPLTRTDEPQVLAEIADGLEKARIPYAVTAGTALALFDDPTVQLMPPYAWEARVWVVPERVEEAQELAAPARERHRNAPRRRTEMNY